MKPHSKKILGLVALIVGLALCGGGLWRLLSPAQYQAKVHVQVGRDDPGVPNPYFIQSEIEIARSGLVLSNVVEKLNLLENWDGHENTMGAAIHRLKRRTMVRPVRNVPWVMQIRVIDKNPKAAARIANAVAGAYCDYKIGIIRQERIRGIHAMDDPYQKEAADIKVQQEHLAKLRKQLNLSNQAPAAAMAKSGDLAYTQAEHSLTNEEAVPRRRKAIIASLKSHENSRTASVSESGIKIVNHAVPPKISIGPNRTLGRVLLICGLAISGFGFYLLSVAVSRTKTKS